ncbi:adenylate/guanylate cyclase domain-containing protein, partial [Ideonella sp.]|uniref:adenylate/guanylate cyclase domain-containing protein n=1 Tax=Ideonella sp. TaxID=1929293 RepID=UPI003BB5966D
IEGQLHPSLALAMLRQASGQPQIKPVLHDLAGDPSRRVLTGLQLQLPGEAARMLPLDERGALRVPFNGPGGPSGGSFQYIKAADVILGRLPAASLRGKLVLVGSSAPGLGDLRPTAVHSAMPGVEIHAALLAGLLAGPLPHRPAWAPGYEACLILLSLLSIGWVASRASVPVALGGTVAVATGLIAAHLLLRHAGGLILPVGSALLLSLLLAALLAARGYLREWHDRRSLLHLFDQYLPPERVRELARDPDFAHHPAANRELTVMFCDLQGFSTLAEHLPPLALRDLLNQYFSTATRIVHAHQGTLDKFIGDAVMAFWGAPQTQADHAARAVRATLALADAAGPLNAELAARGLPGIRFGIGLASGIVCVGDLGSALRRSYTAVGDAVNVAARLESLTRELGVGLLVADSTRALCATNLPDVAWAQVAESPIRGREQSVTIVTPVRLSTGCQAIQSEQVHNWTLAQAAARGDDLTLARAHLARLHDLPISSPPSALAHSETPTLPADLAVLVHGLEQRLARASSSTGAPAP